MLGTASIQFNDQLLTFKNLSLYVHFIIAFTFFSVAAYVWFIGSLYHICPDSLIAQIWYSVFEAVILYVYSLPVSGSSGFLLILSRFLITVSHTVPSIHAVAQLYVTFS
jgi:hypothetical protein